MEDVIEGGVEEEVILPDVIPQGHGVEAVLAAEHQKEVGGVGNVVSVHLNPGDATATDSVHHDDPLQAVNAREEELLHKLDAASAAKGEGAVDTNSEGVVKTRPEGSVEARQKEQPESRSKISELLLSLTGRSKTKEQTAADVKSAWGDLERDPLLPEMDQAEDTRHAGLQSVDADSGTVASGNAQTDLFSRHNASSHAHHEAGVFGSTLTQTFSFGMPFVVICAGVALVFWRRSRGSHVHHHHTPKV